MEDGEQNFLEESSSLMYIRTQPHFLMNQPFEEYSHKWTMMVQGVLKRIKDSVEKRYMMLYLDETGKSWTERRGRREQKEVHW